MRHLTLALGFVILGHSMAAAASPDTWVSGTGADVGNCPATAPCRSFQYALRHTRDGGIIVVASSGSFAGVNITKPVIIAADGVVAVVRKSANCGAVICVNVNGNVTLRGLTIDPMGSGLDGIVVSQVGGFYLQDSIIRHGKIGLLSRSRESSFWGRVEISNSIITGNEIGIKIIALGDSRIALDRVRVHNNKINGILFDDSARAGTIAASVTDSVIAGHPGYGIHAVTTGPEGIGYRPNVSVTLDRTAVLDNGRGISVKGEAARVRIGNSTITGNAVALRSTNNGVIPSYGTNKLDGNGSGEAPTVIISSQ